MYRSAPANVVIDVIGWFTGPSAPASTDGLFVVVADQGLGLADDERPAHLVAQSERVLTPAAGGSRAGQRTAIDAAAPGCVSAC